MKKYAYRSAGWLIVLGALVAIAACAPVKFFRQPESGCPLGQVCNNGNGNHVEQTFVTNSTNGMVDILFVDDNSASMDDEQQNLGQRFSTFISSLFANGQPLDWQIGITTTNVCLQPGLTQENEAVGDYCPTPGSGFPGGAPPSFNWEGVGAQGSLIPFRDANDNVITVNNAPLKILKRDTLSPGAADAAFKNTIQIPISRTGSGDERGIYALNLAVAKAATDNAGFFRPGAALAVVMITDEDERSTGDGTQGTLKPKDMPQTFLDTVQSAFAGEKSVVVHTIVVRNPIPETGQPDTVCLNTQSHQAPIFAPSYYGGLVESLALKTGGRVVDVCLDNYSQALQGIGGDIVAQTNSVTLAHIPIPGSVVVRYLRPGDNLWRSGPEISISESISGKVVTFTPAPPAGTKIDVTYDFAPGNKLEKSFGQEPYYRSLEHVLAVQKTPKL